LIEAPEFDWLHRRPFFVSLWGEVLAVAENTLFMLVEVEVEVASSRVEAETSSRVEAKA
jgi:hypothetical protein